MRVHHLQHVPFEGLGAIEPLLLAGGHQISVTRLYAGEPLPPLEQLDWAIVMGGPMGVYDEAIYPWLKAEKQWIKSVIDAGKIMLGICLGAQLIAEVLGAKVTQNSDKEIGWFPLHCSPALNGSQFAGVFPATFIPLHWHGDTFSLPTGAVGIGASEACQNQGFIYRDRVVALQFHPEMTPTSLATLVDHSRNELDGSRYVQSEQQILYQGEHFADLQPILAALVEVLASTDKTE